MIQNGGIMSGNLLTYSGIITKVKAMESQLLSEEDFSHIANINSTADFITFLKKQPGYAKILEHADENALHRSQIEQLLANPMYMAYESLFHFAGIKQREYLSFIFYRYEIDILKACLQRIYNIEDMYDLSMFENFFKEHSKLNIVELAASKNLDEAITHLKGTEYSSLFSSLQNSAHNTLYDYELQLDIYYFTKIWKRQKKLLEGDDLSAYNSVLGSQIDLLNILWIYRSKKFYDIDSSKIFSTIIPINYKLKQEELMKLIESHTLDDFAKILTTTYYHAVFKEFDSDTIEKKYYTVIDKVYKNTVQKYPMSMAPVQYFLYKKERELDRLTTALECIRYKLDPTQILHYIS